MDTHLQPRRLDQYGRCTFACLGRNRRLARDYEGQTGTEEAWLYLAMTHLMLKRLAL